MTTAITSLFDVQTAIKSSEPSISKILIDLDITERLVMRIYEELPFMPQLIFALATPAPP